MLQMGKKYLLTDQVKFVEDSLLLGPFLNTLSQILVSYITFLDDHQKLRRHQSDFEQNKKELQEEILPE